MVVCILFVVCVGPQICAEQYKRDDGRKQQGGYQQGGGKYGFLSHRSIP